MISLLPKTTQIIQWPVWTLEWIEVFLPFWCQLLFSLLQLQVRNCAIDNFISFIFLILKFISDVGVNLMPSPLWNKLIGSLWLWQVNMLPYTFLLIEYKDSLWNKIYVWLDYIEFRTRLNQFECLKNMKTVYTDENNVVLNEKSVEGKPCINRESKSNELTI